MIPFLPGAAIALHSAHALVPLAAASAAWLLLSPHMWHRLRPAALVGLGAFVLLLAPATTLAAGHL